MDEALKDLEMGEGNRFIALRSSLLDAQGAVRTDIFKPRGDIHLNASGTQIVSLRIQQMLGIMLPILVPVQAPVPVQAQAPAQVQTPQASVQTPAKPQRTRVQAPASDSAPVVNAPPVVNVPLVSEVINAHAVVVQDQVETPMETDEDELLAKLFFKKYGRALPVEKEKEKDAVDQINFVIDLTDNTDEMESDPTPVLIPTVKKEPIESAEADANVVDVAKRRQERRELVKARKAVTAFGKSLRKSNVIMEKEAPTPENVVADSNVSADASVANVEQTIAESDAAIAASKEFTDEFGDTPLDEFDDESEFRLFPDETDVINEDDDAMIDDI
jgi:hypothetical protein